VVRLSCRPKDGTAVIEVSDSGPGIDPADLERVFERFWHQTPPDGAVGSGLGLAMVKAIARAHGGSAEADRAPEGGAAVRMLLPLQSVHLRSAGAEATGPRPAPAAERPASTSPAPDGSLAN
jgi:signal transduction histidine kinase